MNKAAKGKKFEKEVKTILESKGYMVEQAIPKTIFLGKGKIIAIAHDFFGCWDLIAKKIGEPTLWVQVSTVGNLSHKRKQIAKSNYDWNSDFDCPMIMAREEGKMRYRVCYGRDDYAWVGEIWEVVKK